MSHLCHALRLKSCEPDGTFSGYASVFNNVDFQQEVIAKGAFRKSLDYWHKQNKCRVLQEIDLHEISLVTFAANPKAQVTSFKDWLGPYQAVNKLLKRLNDLQGVMSMQELFQFS